VLMKNKTLWVDQMKMVSFSASISKHDGKENSTFTVLNIKNWRALTSVKANPAWIWSPIRPWIWSRIRSPDDFRNLPLTFWSKDAF